MSALQSLLHVWKTVIVYLLVASAILILFAWWFGWVGAIAVFLLEAFLHVSWWIELKSKLLKNLPTEFRCSPTHPEEYPQLDLGLLIQYTEGVRSLNFVHIIDYKLDTVNGLSRLFSHSQHYCFADIFQVYSRANIKQMPMVCTIHSAMEQGWSLSTTNLKPNGLSHTWRNPKSLWSYHPSATPDKLLQAHRERRQQIQENLKVSIVTDLSWEFYFTQQERNAIKRREIFERKNIFIALIEATLFEMNPLSEWMGEYQRAIRKRH